MRELLDILFEADEKKRHRDLFRPVTPEEQDEMYKEEVRGFIEWVQALPGIIVHRDGSLSTNGDVNIADWLDGYTGGEEVQLDGQLPFKFRYVGGDFDCSHLLLHTLKGCPRNVGGSFFCEHNSLDSLEGGPNKVGGMYDCSDNELTTLYGVADTIGDNRVFDCSNNALEEIDELPSNVDGCDVVAGGNVEYQKRMVYDYFGEDYDEDDEDWEIEA